MNKYLLTTITLFLFSTHITVAQDVKSKLSNLFNKKKSDLKLKNEKTKKESDQALEQLSFPKKISDFTRLPVPVSQIVADYLGYFKVIGRDFMCYDIPSQNSNYSTRLTIDEQYKHLIYRDRIYRIRGHNVAGVPSSLVSRSCFDLQKLSIPHDPALTILADDTLKEGIDTTKKTTDELRRCIAGGNQIVPDHPDTVALMVADRSKLIVFDTRSELAPRIFVHDIVYDPYDPKEPKKKSSCCSIS